MRSAEPALDWQLLWKASAAFLLVGAALIHAAWMAIHLQTSMLEGVSFLLIALAQSALAFGVLLVPSRRTYLLAIALSLAVVGMWALSRTVGLPIGPNPGIREPVSTADVVATSFELLTVLAVLPLVVGRNAPDRNQRRPNERWARTYTLVAGMSLSTLALTAVAVVPSVTSAVTGQEGESAIPTRRADAVDAPHDHASQAPAESVPASAAKLTAQQMSFGTRELAMLAGQQVEVSLENLDRVSHNFSVYRDAGFDDAVFNGDVTAAGSSRTYRFRSPAPGRYWFRCDLHPDMNGQVAFS